MSAEREQVPDQGSRRLFIVWWPDGGTTVVGDDANVAGAKTVREVVLADCEWSEMVAYHQDRYSRLQVENERLRETLKVIGPIFPSHVIDVDKGGRWVNDASGDPWFDTGDVHTEDCPACALGRRIDEAVGSPRASRETEQPK